MNEETISKLRDVAENGDIDFAMHCIINEILNSLSVIKSSTDLISLSVQSEDENIKLGIDLTQRSCEEIRLFVDEILARTLFPRLRKD